MGDIEIVYAILSCLKIALYLALFALGILILRIEKKVHTNYGLILTSLSFVLIAITEFTHSLAHINEGFLTWFANIENIHLISKPLFILGGIGLIWYLRGLSKSKRVK